MDNCGKILFGIIVGITEILIIKGAYEYGKFQAIHKIYKRGWKIVDDSENKTQKEES